MTEVVPAGATPGQWSEGLFGCFSNCGLCLKAYFCPCLVFGQTAASIDKPRCLWTCFFFVPVWNLLKFVELRREIRERSGIEGGCVGDCLTTLLCGECALIQEAKQVQALGLSPQSMARE